MKSDDFLYKRGKARENVYFRNEDAKHIKDIKSDIDEEKTDKERKDKEEQKEMGKSDKKKKNDAKRSKI